MSIIGELMFFLGLQIHQSPCGIFISQSKYTLELLKKHGMDGCDSISTPMATARLNADLQGTPTDQMKYHSMIGGLMYLTASRPDIGFNILIDHLLFLPFSSLYVDTHTHSWNIMEESVYSRRNQTNINDVSFIEPYEYPEPVVHETKVSSDQNGQTDQDDHNDQNDQSVQNDEILNDDHSEHYNHTNDEQIIDNLPNTKDI
ncbi:retrovirus-related pol polyprotein from transposon TNT 1-94 [Tanacetum coccineum]